MDNQGKLFPDHDPYAGMRMKLTRLLDLFREIAREEVRAVPVFREWLGWWRTYRVTRAIRTIVKLLPTVNQGGAHEDGG